MPRSEPSWVVELIVARQHRASFERLTRSMVAAARKEPGTLIYERFKDGDGRYVIYERYRSPAAARAHLERFMSCYAARFSSLVRRTSFRSLGVTDPRLCQLLGEQAATPFGRLAGFRRRQ